MPKNDQEGSKHEPSDNDRLVTVADRTSEDIQNDDILGATLVTLVPCSRAPMGPIGSFASTPTPLVLSRGPYVRSESRCRRTRRIPGD